MHRDDDDLRARFRVLADEDATLAPPFSRETIGAKATPVHGHSRFPARRIAAIVASVVVALVTLTIGLVLGTSTGYASARVEGERDRDAIAATTVGVNRQLSVLRSELARTRSDLMQLAAKGTVTPASLLAAEAVVDSMSANVARIERHLRDGTDARPVLALLGTIPVKNAITALTCGAVAAAPLPKPRQQGIPVIALPNATARSMQTLGSALSVVQEPGGGVLVNDGARRQIKLFDSTLANPTTILDSASGAANSYGRAAATLFRFVGDSALFPDFNARAMLVLDERGQVARSLALPNPNDLASVAFSKSATDRKGRLFFTSHRKISLSRTVAGMSTPGTFGDSIPLLRADLESRHMDTLAMLARPLAQVSAFTADGKTVIHQWMANPIATIDEWSLLADGSVAIVRGQDYHIDWIRPGGAVESSPKLPFDWRRLTDAEKQRILDSTRAVLHAKMRDTSTRRTDIEAMSRLPTDVSALNTPSGSGGGRAGGGGPGRSCGMLCDLDLNALVPSPSDVIPIEKMPDYLPPVRTGTSLADLDGNLWILPTTSKQSKQGELVYDIVNAKGDLTKRVRVPLGRLIVGFGKNGIVYMVSGDKANGFFLERTKLPSTDR